MTNNSWEENQAFKRKIKGVNVDNINQTVKSIDEFTRETREMIDKIHNNLMALDARIRAVENSINTFRSNVIGSGPTKR